jgi:O-succinylbenzoic acid--CoA ligase
MASQVTTSTADGDPAKSGRVLPGRMLKICPSGEIIVRGDTLCLGYYRDGEVEPVVDECGWLHTKDIGDLDDGDQLSVIGRIDNMFISGGENIHPETIERTMTHVFSIEQVVVVPVPEKDFGSRPVAFVNGVLPLDWQETLQTKLQAFEIPLAVYSWPAEAEGAIKPNRKMLQSLAEKR